MPRGSVSPVCWIFLLLKAWLLNLNSFPVNLWLFRGNLLSVLVEVITVFYAVLLYHNDFVAYLFLKINVGQISVLVHFFLSFNFRTIVGDIITTVVKLFQEIDLVNRITPSNKKDVEVIRIYFFTYK